MIRSENKWIVESDEFGGDILRWDNGHGVITAQIVTAAPEIDEDDAHDAYDWLVKCVTEHESYY